MPFPETKNDNAALTWLCSGMTICLLLATISATIAIYKPAPPPGRCDSCGYDTAGLPTDAKCPECGKAKPA